MKERKKSLNKLLKRALIVALCLVMALGTTVTIMAASFNGDLDGDGKITAYDAQLLAEYQAGDRDLDPATVIGLTIRGILDRVLGKIVDEPVEEPSESTVIEETFEVKIDENNLVTEEQVITVDNVTVTVPVGVKVDSAVLILTVQQKDTEDGSVNLEEGQEQLPLDIHIEGISEENTVPVIITISGALEAGLNQGNLALYHVENGEAVAMTQVMTAEELTAHNQFYYDPATGDVTIATVSFSVFRIVSENAKLWEGQVDHSWYDAEATELTIFNADQLWSFSQIVGGMAKDNEGNAIAQDSFEGKVVNLAVDIDLGDKVDPNVDYSEDDRVFYPIGYYNSEGTYKKSGVAITSGFYTFRGTFDGQGHTIANFYHNTWEMKGDHNWYDATLQYYRDGMGLFGKVYGGTVKNLTVENFSSDGEIATTGTIAAYADCGATFENISIFNCNPRVYNIGNGGIVGCVGWYANDKHDEPVTFKNITVDNTNKISALWGSWDVACGGLVGQYYPTSGQSNAIDNAGIHMENCHVAAQIDVNNDVCANYQYYAYRYAGILIGSIRENETIDGREYPKMDGITASRCTVHFGDWNDYYYCELVANSLASYTHDHQMSRLTQVKAVDVENKTVTYLNSTTAVAIPASGTYNYVVVDGAHATENATCYHFVNGVQHLHESKGTETVDGQTVLVEDKQHLYLEFNNLCTGYGWGVTSKGVEDLEGVTILDRTVADSVVKFESAEGAANLAIENGIAITLGDLFADADSEVDIYTPALNVSVTDLADDGVNTTVELIKEGENWTDYKVIFHGVSNVEVTIQDYYYCAPTSINLTVSAHIHCLCGDETELNAECENCGTKAAIWEPLFDTQIPNYLADGHYYLAQNQNVTATSYQSGDVAICLNGCDVQYAGGSRYLQVNGGANVSTSDCTATVSNGKYDAGKITGFKLASVHVLQNGTFNLYDGIFTGNTNGSGIIVLGNSALENECSVFNMYGGEISGNELRVRGAVFTQLPSAAYPYPGEIHISGGAITGNTSHAQDSNDNPNSGVAGGAGIYSFGEVTVSGTAKVYDNVCTVQSNKNPDIYLRVKNDGNIVGEDEEDVGNSALAEITARFEGKLIVGELDASAIINYGSSLNEHDVMIYIEKAAGATIETGPVNIKYDNDQVYYDVDANQFSTKHTHCLCGAETTAGNTCSECQTVAQIWTPVYNSMPNDTAGYYYLRTDIAKETDKYYSSQGLHICLNGHNIVTSREDTTKSDTAISIWKGGEVTLSDCDTQEDVGVITGTKFNATIKVIRNSSFAMYGGTISGNGMETPRADSIVWVQDGAIAGDEIGTESEQETATGEVPGGVFKMYGGVIKDNIAVRSAVYTNAVETGRPTGTIHLLGGTITNNTANPASSVAGGAGVYAFGDVYIGGTAKVYGNSDTYVQNSNIFLRNEGDDGQVNQQGKLIVSTEVPLAAGADINYNTKVAETNLLNLQSISGKQETWDASWVEYNGQKVSHLNDTFYIEGASYCMCGKTTSGTCATCGSEPVAWTAWDRTDSLPTTGNYYLTGDITLGTTNMPHSVTNLSLNLNGYDIKGSTMRMISVSGNSVLNITDFTDDVGVITNKSGAGHADGVLKINSGATFNLYNGKFNGNNNTNQNGGVINVTSGGTFNMYGGELSGNTITRGTVYGAASDSVIRILGGIITNNTATSTNSNVAGGAGIYSFGPVTVGGTAQIHSNLYAEGANKDNNVDIYLRNTTEYAGKIILSAEVPLERGAKINFGTHVVAASAAGAAMSYIDFEGAAYSIQDACIYYNENQVCYGNIAAEGETEQLAFYYVEATNDGGEGEAEAEPAE